MSLVKEAESRNLWQRAKSVLETVTYRPQTPALPYVRPAEECLADLLPINYRAEAQKRAARNAAFEGLTDFARPRQSTDFLPSGLGFTATSEDAKLDTELASGYRNLVSNALQAGGSRRDIAAVVGVGPIIRTDNADDGSVVFRNNLRLNGHI